MRLTCLIDAIRWISDLLDPDSGEINSVLYAFELLFQDNNDEIRYSVEADYKSNIIQEKFIINNEVKLDREKGELYYNGLGKSIRFGTNTYTLAISRIDNFQQPFFETLHN